MRLTANRNVLVAGERLITNVAAKVLYMPSLVFSTGVFSSKYELVTSVAPRDVGVGCVIAGAEKAPTVKVV
jgi:hypothetical protein